MAESAMPLVTWAVELDAAGTKAALQAILDDFKAELQTLGEVAKATKVDLDTTGLDNAKRKIDDTRKSLEDPIQAKVVGPEFPLAGMFARLNQPGPEAAEPARPATVQGGLASAPIREAREELLATQKTAEGVGAAVRLVNQDLREMGVAPEFSKDLKSIQRDFVAGRATAEEAIAAIRNVRAEGAEFAMEADRRIAENFKRMERDKKEAAEETRRSIEAQRETMGRFASISQGLTTTAGSVGASFVQMRIDSERAAGATEHMLFGLNQAQNMIPHLVGIGSNIGTMISGGPMGMLLGGLGVVSSIGGLIMNAVRPPPPPEQRKETTEDTFARVQQGALRGDAQLSTQRDILSAVLKIAGAVTGTAAEATPTVAP